MAEMGSVAEALQFEAARGASQRRAAKEEQLKRMERNRELAKLRRAACAAMGASRITRLFPNCPVLSSNSEPWFVSPLLLLQLFGDVGRLTGLLEAILEGLDLHIWRRYIRVCSGGELGGNK